MNIFFKEFLNVELRNFILMIQTQQIILSVIQKC